MAPKVQTIAEAMAELDPAYAASRNIVAQKQALIPAKYDAQRASINAAKGAGFNDISTNMNRRGVVFGGLPADEQATYLATKYLPGMMDTNTNQNAEDLALQGELVNLGKEQTNAAMARIDQQKNDLNSWNKMIAEQQFTARENSKNRAASAASSAADMVSPDEAAIRYLDVQRGKDGYVSPTAFRNARTLYLQAGGDNKTFMTRYWNYTGANTGQPNNKKWKSYYYGS